VIAHEVFRWWPLWGPLAMGWLAGGGMWLIGRGELRSLRAEVDRLGGLVPLEPLPVEELDEQLAVPGRKWPQPPHELERLVEPGEEWAAELAAMPHIKSDPATEPVTRIMQQPATSPVSLRRRTGKAARRARHHANRAIKRHVARLEAAYIPAGSPDFWVRLGALRREAEALVDGVAADWAGA